MRKVSPRTSVLNATAWFSPCSLIIQTCSHSETDNSAPRRVCCWKHGVYLIIKHRHATLCPSTTSYCGRQKQGTDLCLKTFSMHTVLYSVLHIDMCDYRVLFLAAVAVLYRTMSVRRLVCNHLV